MAYDEDVHELATRFPIGVLSLVGVRPRGSYRVEAVEVKARRRLDLVFTPEDPRDPRVYLEWQGWRDPELERRMLEELVIHCVRTGTFAPVVAAIVYTAPETRAAALPADIGHPGGDVVRFTPVRVVLPEIAPEALLAAGGAALVALPLVGPEERVRADAHAWFQTVRSQAPTASERASATDLFVRLLSWRLGTMDVKQLLTGEEDAMKETATGRALLAEGRAEGHAKGFTEGREKGRAEERRRTVLLVLELRLGAVPGWVGPRLEQEHDLERLEALLEGARQVTSEADVRALLGGDVS